jgi:hypothetical protein
VSTRRYAACGLSFPKRPMVPYVEQYGGLTVIGFPFYAVLYQSKGSEQCVVCECDCGAKVVATCNSIKQGGRESCSPSCGRKEHGMTNSPEFTSWTAMKKRCYENGGRDRYREKGITVCDRWLHSFANFFADMGPKPSPRHTIERENNSGNYEPGNCVWALPVQQQRNRDNCVYVTVDGRRMTVTEAAEILGLKRDTVFSRLKMGWSFEDAVKTPIRKYRKASQ